MILLTKIKKNLYLIVPILCILTWALYYIIKEGFVPNLQDFPTQWEVGLVIRIDPSEIYNKELRYFYLPSMATFIGVPLSFLPIYFAHYVYYSIITLLAIISMLLFNKILILRDLKNKLYRFLLLVIISNGFFLFYQFYMTQSKFIVTSIFLFIIWRELNYNKNNKKKDQKYYIINYSLFIFAIGVFPYFVFFLLIYVFHDFPLNNIKNKENLKIYSIVILIFIIENFLCILYPSLIFDILGLFIKHNTTERNWGFPLFYFKEWEWIYLDNYNLLIIISTIFIIIISIILILNKKMEIVEKFGYFSFACLIFSSFAERSMVIIIPFILLLFVPYINQDEKGMKFIKNNKIVIIGLLSMAAIALMPNNNTFFKYIPISQEVPFIYLIFLRWIIALGLVVGSFFILLFKGKRYKLEYEPE